MNKLKKKIIIIIGLITLMLGILEIPLISYLLMQAGGQLEVLWNARAIDEVLNDETFDESIKGKIMYVKEVKHFADSALGLKSANLYTTIYDQKGEDILWNLSASKPFALESVEWNFPIVGSVSYKGFFNLKKAKIEEEDLMRQGYDTRIRPVNAWSTLGWFSDPILSKNLRRNKGSIAELFIHEITHANIFIKDSLSFNENLASFIGEQGAEQFVRVKFGAESMEYLTYVQSEHDVKKYTSHCLEGLKGLDSLYGTFHSSWSAIDKRKAKKNYILGWKSQLKSLVFFDCELYHNLFRNKLPNNAFFMAFERYASKKEDFEIQLRQQFQGDLGAFVQFYNQKD